ncbi:MAG: 4'-phosphopantetheinyl transferase superfamily protein [Zetaproteobacteria bacterium]|nr:4'-phosphopantetheinyl transferase superfamily protein [Zetaproteobacteria bacterium]
MGKKPFLTSVMRVIDPLCVQHAASLLGIDSCDVALKCSPAFCAGRLAAWEALQNYGLAGDATVIGRFPSGAPKWPEGFCGSISHNRHVAWAVVSGYPECISVGIDVEEASRFVSKFHLWKRIACVQEQVRLQDLPFIEAEVLCLLFSAKEAIYKCIFPVVGHFFGFHEACYVGRDTSNILCFHLSNRLKVSGAPVSIRVHFRFVQGHFFCIALHTSEF